MSGTPSSRVQFRVLYRDFLFRIVDLEILSAHGDAQKLLGQFAAILAAFSFTAALLTVPKYAASILPQAKIVVAAWPEQEFWIATTMAIAGLFAVLAWNAVFPTRRDCLVLGLLPVDTLTICRAKVAAIATALGVSVVALHLFVGLVFPALWMPPAAGSFGVLRAFAAYWATMLAAAAFVCCALFAIQGLAAQLLPYRHFLTVSSWIQLAAFFFILGAYFLKPPFPPPAALAWLPSYWFLGLYQELNGPTGPGFGPMAVRAICGLAVAAGIAAATFVLAYRGSVRRIVEQPDIVPSRQSRLAPFLAARLFPRPLDRAIVLFTARTIARSRQHRLLLAAYAGVGLAISLVYSKDLLYGYSGVVWDTMRRNTSASAHWDRPNIPFLIASLVMLAFAVFGSRAVFSMPVALPANWVFRITAVHSPAAYFAAVRKALFALAAAPIWLVSVFVYFAVWPARPALQHLAVLLATAIVLVQTSLYHFCKIPFACSYLPGKSNLNVKLGAYAIFLLFAADRGVNIEYAAITGRISFLVLITVLAAVAVWAWKRTAAYAATPAIQLEFDDVPPADINALDLHAEAAWSTDDAYVDEVDRDRPSRPPRPRNGPPSFLGLNAPPPNSAPPAPSV